MFTPNSNPLKSSAMTSGYDKIKHPPDPSCEMTHGFGSCLDNFGASPSWNFSEIALSDVHFISHKKGIKRATKTHPTVEQQSIANTRKYQKISENIRTYQKISENIRKYQKISEDPRKHQFLPSGKLTKSYWKSPFFMGKSTISTGPFPIAFCLFTRG